MILETTVKKKIVKKRLEARKKEVQAAVDHPLRDLGLPLLLIQKKAKVIVTEVGAKAILQEAALMIKKKNIKDEPSSNIFILILLKFKQFKNIIVVL